MKAIKDDRCHWEIGRRIVAHEQGGEARAGYGQALITRLADDLSRRFGRGFGRANLASMRAFYLAWPETEIFQTVSGKSVGPDIVQTPSGLYPRSQDAQGSLTAIPEFLQLVARFALPWSAYVRLLSVKTAAARAFYEAEALREGWSVRQFDRQIGSQLYERLTLSRNKGALLLWWGLLWQQSFTTSRRYRRHACSQRSAVRQSAEGMRRQGNSAS